MNKLNRMLDCWMDGKKVNGISTPPLATIYELLDIARGHSKETINSTVVSVLNKCGIKTKERGIGWVIV